MDDAPVLAFAPVASFEDVGPERFLEIFRGERPAILRGLVKSWPAVAAGLASAEALIDYLKPMDAGRPVSAIEIPARAKGRLSYADDLSEHNFSQRELPFATVLDRILKGGGPDAPSFAVQMLPTQGFLPAFPRDNPCPLLPPEIGPRLWVGGRTTSRTHNDHEHNLACVVAGRRRFVLFPPEQVANLYVGPPGRPPVLSLVKLEAPDFETYPRARAAFASATEAGLEPGDALFIPKHWWHHVEALSPFNVLANYWWGESPPGLESPNNAFQAALLALKDLPPGERAYWRAMFETYVFQVGGDPVAHLPAELRGSLGRVTGRARDQLKRDLLNSLAKG